MSVHFIHERGISLKNTLAADRTFPLFHADSVAVWATKDTTLINEMFANTKSTLAWIGARINVHCWLCIDKIYAKLNAPFKTNKGKSKYHEQKAVSWSPHFSSDRTVADDAIVSTDGKVLFACDFLISVYKLLKYIFLQWELPIDLLYFWIDTSSCPFNKTNIFYVNPFAWSVFLRVKHHFELNHLETININQWKARICWELDQDQRLL